MATAEQIRNFVPSVRVAIVQPSDATVLVTLPATTSAFSVANMFARASGYIDKRFVDIGDRVKEGQLLAEIVAPELDHQIAQAEATLGQLRAAVEQAQANKNLAQVTWDRDKGLVEKGWVTPQQGDIDRFTLNAREAALGVAQANVAAQQAQLNVLYQQKAYQRVVAPFEGVVTQRNVDVGDLVHADTTTGTFMFTIMQSTVIRAQVYVPQDSAFGLGPGVDAVVRVPEIPDRTFPGKVARIADALQPGTRTLLTEVDIPNPDGTLTAGVYCTIELRVPRKTPSLLVPADAIIFNRNGLQVAVIEDGTAHIRKVSVTRDLGTQVEVGDGVKQGDQVIVNPPVSLIEGSKVRPRAEPAAART
jgi:RND family efflux transporter MFP subunit